MSSNKKLLVKGLFFSYGALFTQIFYSLASIPLALEYLSKAEFGMWGLILTITGYLGLLEFGMTNAFQRHLFECRDTKEDGRYGRYYTASMITLVAIAIAVLAIGFIASYFAPDIFNIPKELNSKFKTLLLGQVAIAAASLATRMVGAPLQIYQRHDLIQISSMVLYVVLYAVLYVGLKLGWGIYAMLANVFVGYVWGLLFGMIACYKLGYYPAKGTWKIPMRHEWNSVVSYSKNLFVVQIGNQLANGLPMLLLPRLFGLEATAVWTVCTRTFGILNQVVTKPMDMSVPWLCELYVKGQAKRMGIRWSQVTQMTMALAVLVFTVGASYNGHFVQLWVGENMRWPAINDWLIALYYLVTILSNSVFSTIGIEKNFGNTIFAPYIESVLLVILSVLTAHYTDVSGLIIAAIFAKLIGRLVFGTKYLSSITGLATVKLLRDAFLKPTLMLPFAFMITYACGYLYNLHPSYYGLIASAFLSTLFTSLLMFFYGLSKASRQDVVSLTLKPLFRKFSKNKKTTCQD